QYDVLKCEIPMRLRTTLDFVDDRLIVDLNEDAFDLERPQSLESGNQARVAIVATQLRRPLQHRERDEVLAGHAGVVDEPQRREAAPRSASEHGYERLALAAGPPAPLHGLHDISSISN